MTNNIKPYLFLVLCGCSLVMLSFGYRAGFGLFMEPLSDARGWGREVLATAFAVQNLVWGLCALLAGGVADSSQYSFSVLARLPRCLFS